MTLHDSWVTVFFANYQRRYPFIITKLYWAIINDGTFITQVYAVAPIFFEGEITQTNCARSQRKRQWNKGTALHHQDYSFMFHLWGCYQLFLVLGHFPRTIIVEWVQEADWLVDTTWYHVTSSVQSAIHLDGARDNPKVIISWAIWRCIRHSDNACVSFK